MKYIDFQKMYNAGITDTHMGGEVVNDQYFCRRDVEENDYSEPTYEGKLLVNKTIKMDDQFIVVNGSLILTKDEYAAGIMEV